VADWNRNVVREFVRRFGITIGRFELGRRDHAQLAMQAAVVEPVDVLQRGVLHFALYVGTK
jgi:hypothetical protein